MLKREIPRIVNWLKKIVAEANSEGLTFGLSGGVDSAVVAALSKLAFPEQTLGIGIPIHSDPQDASDAKLVARALDLIYYELDLTTEHELIMNKLVTLKNADSNLAKHRLVDANLRARLRMSTIYAVANEFNYLVVGTDNKSEYYTGYFTKFGDGACDLLPLAEFTKTEIYQLATILDVPKEILNKAPSAGLWVGQTDEKEMGTTYEYIDAFLQGKQVPKQDREIIERMHLVSAHKRALPPKYPREI